MIDLTKFEQCTPAPWHREIIAAALGYADPVIDPPSPESEANMELAIAAPALLAEDQRLRRTLDRILEIATGQTYLTDPAAALKSIAAIVAAEMEV